MNQNIIPISDGKDFVVQYLRQEPKVLTMKDYERMLKDSPIDYYYNPNGQLIANLKKQSPKGDMRMDLRIYKEDGGDKILADITRGLMTTSECKFGIDPRTAIVEFVYLSLSFRE